MIELSGIAFWEKEAEAYEKPTCLVPKFSQFQHLREVEVCDTLTHTYAVYYGVKSEFK